MAGQIVIQGQLTGIPLGTIQVGPLTIAANTANELYIATYTLASGANTINVPASVGALIEPDPSNTVGLTLKGVTGDTGITISHITPTLLTWPAVSPATFVLTAASVFSTVTSITFF